MNFTFNEDQHALRDSISRFLMVEAAPEKLRAIWQTDAGRSTELRSKLAEQGITALSVPEASGGLGLGDVDWSLMNQELGYFGIPDSLSDTAYLATGLLSALPDQHPLREKWLPLIADGSVRIALGHPVNPWVADAHLADLLLLANPTPGGTEWHALTPDQVNAEACPSIDASRRLATITWQATDANRIADASSGQKLADDLLDRGALGVSAQLLGLAQRMLDKAK